jgi:protein tyrosine/serine phosphatase
VDEHASRFLDLDGVFNFRDLGGLPTHDGRVTRRGLMFRSDALHHLEPGAVEHLVNLGVCTIVDLRSTVELERTGRGLLEATPIGWLHAPLTHGDAAAGNVLPAALAEGDLGRHYVESLPERSDTLALVIRHLADRANLPAVFHCTAGKDRTGMVAALVLSLVGVADDVIVHDYTLTDDRMAGIMERIAASGAFPADAAPLPATVGRAEAPSMETFLTALRGEYGGAEGWAASAGLSDDTLASLRDTLLAPAS